MHGKSEYHNENYEINKLGTEVCFSDQYRI